MKQRVISAICGVALVVTVFLLNTNIPIGLNFIISIISIIALYEIQVATGYVKNVMLSILSFIYSTVVMFLPIIVEDTASLIAWIGTVSFAYLVILFLFMLKNHEKISLNKISLVFLTTIIITVAMLSIILMRDAFGIFHVIMLLVMSWSTDICALFSGMLFGKHKLAPKISPNKTIEGAIGGFIMSIIVTVLLAIAYEFFGGFRNASIDINFVSVIFLAMCSSLLAVFGDLSFSIIKRHCNIKDFGHIMPGHGGVLDRFDSIIFAAPFVLLFVTYFPIF